MPHFLHPPACPVPRGSPNAVHAGGVALCEYPQRRTLIAQLSNVDRHRHLTPTLPRVAVHQHVKYANGIESISTVGGLQHGSEIKPFTIDIDGPDKPVDVKRSFSPYVTFEELTIGAGPATLEIQNVLEVCLEQVKRAIVPAFIHLLKNP